MALMSDGSTRREDWKSWRSHEAEVTLLWEVKRILPDNGLVSRSHRTKVCNYARAREETWRDLVQLLGFAPDEVYGRSTTAVKVDRGQDQPRRSSGGRTRILDEHQHGPGLPLFF